jgi:hypothetical protein
MLTSGFAPRSVARARPRLAAALSVFLLGACDDHHESVEPVYAQASAALVQVRPRETIIPGMTMANDPNAVTSWWPIMGSATFKTTRDGVDVSVAFKSCRDAYSYPVAVYESADCSSLQKGAEPWDGERGTIPVSAFCIGAPGARAYHSRLRSDEKPWSLGGRASSNLIGHSLAVLDPDTLEPLACGKIELPDGGMLAPAFDSLDRPSDEALAQAAGSCLLSKRPGGSDAGAPCPDLPKLADCAFVHCVASCLAPCRAYLDCLETHPKCSTECSQELACSKCLEGGQCALGHCRKQVTCPAPVTPDGPCSELRACCMRQGPLTNSCLNFVTSIEELSGDPTCIGTLVDWDFNTNFAYRSPCYPDGGAPSE